jgi:phosphoglycerate dehydrogenase-like enzyme
LPNVVATPHVGFVTQQTYRTFYGDTVKNIAAWLASAAADSAPAGAAAD